jgi:hypothetical protein
MFWITNEDWYTAKIEGEKFEKEGYGKSPS